MQPIRGGVRSQLWILLHGAGISASGRRLLGGSSASFVRGSGSSFAPFGGDEAPSALVATADATTSTSAAHCAAEAQATPILSTTTIAKHVIATSEPRDHHAVNFWGQRS